MSVDWTQPIEAVGKDGRAFPASCVSYNAAMKYQAVEWNDGRDRYHYFDSAGISNIDTKDFIRNVTPQPDTVPVARETWERVVALVKQVKDGTAYASDAAELLKIIEPVDPDLEAARAFAVVQCDADGTGADYIRYLRDGAYDTSDRFILAYLAAAKAVRERNA